MQNDKTKEFLQKLKDSGHWNDGYDYSKVEYVNSKDKVIVIDKKFGTEHLLSPNSLLNGRNVTSTNLKEGIYNFERARDFVRKLNLQSSNEWRIYSKTERPYFIPGAPEKIYKNDGWISWGDWLGTNSIATFNQVFDYLDFEQARDFVRKLKLKNQKEWFSYVKENQNPKIPRSPDRVYKNKGWVSWGDWLGTGVVADRYKKFYSYENAKQYLSELNLKTSVEYLNHLEKNDIKFLPRAPQTKYSEKFEGWSEFLSVKIEYVPFGDAKKEILGKFKNQYDFKNYIKENDIKHIPLTPNTAYKDDWISWYDFLGKKEGFKKGDFVDYNEAKRIIKPFNLKSESEFRDFTKKENFPIQLPVGVESVYSDCFGGWADFLGYLGDGNHNWYKSAILSFIKSLENELTTLDSVELITIINSNNLAKKIKELGRLEDLVSSTAGTQERQNIVNNIIGELEGQNENEEVETVDVTGDESEFEETLEEDDTSGVTEETIEEELEPLNPIQELHMYDNNMVTASLDDENIDFLMKNQLKKLWNRVLNGKVDVEQYKQEAGGERFTIIKNWFFEEYEEVNKIKTPTDYYFLKRDKETKEVVYKNDRPVINQPNLMQKLITYRIQKEKRYGNWSGTGAGKTLSAIFAGRYAGAKNTLIICNNATVEGWVNSIHEYFTNNTVYTKRTLEYTDPKLYTVVDKYNVNFKKGDNNYFVLNYETFQQDDGEYVVSELLKNNIIDYIILDEVQNVKQRDEDESTRRNVINKLVIHSSEKNEDLLVMAMSATPVINNLTEPKKLIELLTGEIHNELETRENILNGIEMYKALTRHGLRYKPNYGISVNEEIIEVDGSHLSEDIIKIPRGAVVDFESVLIKTKLDAVADKIKKGTLIYTHYVTEFSHIIGEYVENLGFTVGYYTGQDKSGLRRFKDGKIDVLIGSSPVGTGVDGIQYVCNTLIPIVLPWTSSEYDQLVGRVNRQGSKFDNVNIYIPQVVIPLDNGTWSWDKRRHNIIKFKATLADLAVDGRVPKNLLPSRSKLVEDAKKELADWVGRLQGNDIITFEREEMVIPLNPKLIEKNRNKLGDFSDMNKKWSTTRSNNTHERLSKDPREWYYYHTLYSEKRKTWSEIPYEEIAKKIQSRPDWTVGDFGCGENLLSKEINNKVYAFDHVAIDDDVIACDIMNVPIEDGILDVAVFSLSLMGSNHKDYFKEAYRTLKVYGNIFVCEPASKWEGREGELKEQLESVGFKCFEGVKNTDKFIYIDGVKY